MAKNERRKRRKSEKSLKIRKNSDGTVTVKTDDFLMIIDVKSESGQKRAEMVRWAILEKGLVFTTKMEKIVQNELGRARPKTL